MSQGPKPGIGTSVAIVSVLGPDAASGLAAGPVADGEATGAHAEPAITAPRTQESNHTLNSLKSEQIFRFRRPPEPI